jgi:transposase
MAEMIRIEVVWVSTAPLDLRAGLDTLLARVVQVFGEARPHHAYPFANRRATRMKVLVHDGIGIWLAVRRLHQGHFLWPQGSSPVNLTRPQFDALILGLPWQNLREGGVIRLL